MARGRGAPPGRHVAHASHEDVAGFLKTLKATDSGVGPSASGSLAAAAPTCPAATEPTPDGTGRAH